MKKLLRTKLYKISILLVCAICLPSMANAQSSVLNPTNDYFYIEDGCTLVPGGSRTSFYVCYNAEDSQLKYTAYNLDIFFPEGVQIDWNGDSPRVTMYKGTGCVYPYTVEEVENDEGEFEEEKVYTHTVVSNVLSGDEQDYLRVGCYSIRNEELTALTGRLFRVYLTASPYLKPGPLTLTFKNQKFTIVEDARMYVPAETTSTAVTVSNTSTVTITVSASNKFGTCILPFAAEIPEGLQVYSCKSTSGEYLVLEQQTAFEAYTPYIIYAENGFSGTLTGTVDADKYRETVTDGYLTGTVVTSEVTGGNGCYVMQNQGDGAMFYSVGDTPFAINPGKCWLTVPEASQGSARFRLDGFTAIDTVTGNAAGSSVIYDLTGRRVDAVTAPGIYIVNGKKVKY